MYVEIDSIKHDYNFRQHSNGFILFLKIIYQSQGLLLPLVRLSEPYFYDVLMKNITGRFDKKCEMENDLSFLDRGLTSSERRRTVDLDIEYRNMMKQRKRKAAEKNKNKMPSMYLFLASSLNVELVYIILKGIT